MAVKVEDFTDEQREWHDRMIGQQGRILQMIKQEQERNKTISI